MIASSRGIKALAVVAALGAHAALALALMPKTAVEMEGATGATEVRLGTSFADMAAGTLQAQTATEAAEPPAERPEAAVPSAPEALADSASQATARRPDVQPAESVPQRSEAEHARPAPAMRAEIAPARTPRPRQAEKTDAPRPAITAMVQGTAPVAVTDRLAEGTEPLAAQPSETAPSRTPESPAAAAESPPAPRAEAPAPERLEAVMPETAATSGTGAGSPERAAAPSPAAQPATTAETAQTAAPPERAAASDANPAAVARSLRPQPRRPETETRAEAVQQAEARAAAARQEDARRAAERRQAEAQREAERRAQAARQGNAEQNARAGQAAGQAQAEAVSRGAGGQSPETGNAAASNYPGEVMRKLSRVRRPSVSARGAAVVAFRIAPSGALAGLSIARSSGSTRLDRAALTVVQRAAPFPPPPQGAQRSFSIEIAGR